MLFPLQSASGSPALVPDQLPARPGRSQRRVRERAVSQDAGSAAAGLSPEERLLFEHVFPFASRVPPGAPTGTRASEVGHSVRARACADSPDLLFTTEPTTGVHRCRCVVVSPSSLF